MSTCVPKQVLGLSAQPTQESKDNSDDDKKPAAVPTAAVGIGFEKGRCSLGPLCRCPEGELRPKYKCKRCGVQLHNYVQGCSDTLDDNKVQCKDGEGCSKRNKAANTKKGKADETKGKPPAVAAAVVRSPMTPVKMATTTTTMTTTTTTTKTPWRESTLKKSGDG